MYSAWGCLNILSLSCLLIIHFNVKMHLKYLEFILWLRWSTYTKATTPVRSLKEQLSLSLSHIGMHEDDQELVFRFINGTTRKLLKIPNLIFSWAMLHGLLYPTFMTLYSLLVYDVIHANGLSFFFFFSTLLYYLFPLATQSISRHVITYTWDECTMCLVIWKYKECIINSFI